LRTYGMSMPAGSTPFKQKKSELIDYVR
jgi:hypothetical protein